jgi:hypothetical protein
LCCGSRGTVSSCRHLHCDSHEQNSVYQGRFVAVPVQKNRSVARACHYVNNPENLEELAAMRTAIRHHQPTGSR